MPTNPISIYSCFYLNEVHRFFPSSFLPVPCSLFPVPCSLKPETLYSPK
ncbi:MAG: hypothetical protein F6K55_06630 [Moorea sp. SIO4A3]|nr:hypothetical protein [Moorena sp. SIO4A3]NEQ79013.1 hypothetical protein [Moorena sp. SIO2I5]